MAERWPLKFLDPNSQLVFTDAHIAPTIERYLHHSYRVSCNMSTAYNYLRQIPMTCTAYCEVLASSSNMHGAGKSNGAPMFLIARHWFSAPLSTDGTYRDSLSHNEWCCTTLNKIWHTIGSNELQWISINYADIQ